MGNIKEGVAFIKRPLLKGLLGLKSFTFIICCVYSKKNLLNKAFSMTLS